MASARNRPRKWELGDLVGFENEIWEVCGYSLQVGYCHVSWLYYLITPNWEADGNAKGKREIAEDKISPYVSIVEKKRAEALAQIDKYTKLAEQAKENLKKLENES